MNTKVIKITNQEIKENPYLLREAAKIIAEGEVVAFPTETVYGLGANALNEKAVRKIFELKGRPSDNPLIVHLHSKELIKNYAEISNEVEKQIVEDLMPGPLTLILKKKEIISSIVTAGLPTVGIRIPYNPIAQKLIELSGVPISAPSANLSGKPSATEAQTVIEEFAGKIPFVIDGGKTHIGIESTVIMVKEEETKYSILILRPGFITKEDLENFVNENKFSKQVEVIYSENIQQETPLSPGQKYKHYSPKSHVAIIKDFKKAEELIKDFKNEKIGVLGRKNFLKEVKKILTYLGVKNIFELEWCEYDLIDCARNLFFAYRIFDKENVAIILVEYLEEKGLGYSIMNRVKKSSTYFI
ncbi:MAG: L-threonylcarbamoyladenylate synthase [Brevinematia bacterium]